MSTAARRQQPLVRGACEACHARKARCVLPPEGGPCVLCVNTENPCYFLPRARSGRPRTSVRSLQKDNSPQQVDSPQQNEFSNPEKTPGLVGGDAGGHTVFDAAWDHEISVALEQFDSGTSTNVEASHGHMNTFALPDAGIAYMDPATFEGFLDRPHHRPILQGTYPHQSRIDPVGINFDGFSSTADRTEESSSDTCKRSPVILGSETFSTMLRLTGELSQSIDDLRVCLQKHKQGQLEPDISIKNTGLLNFLQTIDSTTLQVLGAFEPFIARGTPLSAEDERLLAEHGLVSLTAILKIVHALELLADYRLSPSGRQSAEFLVLQKRCDFNLAQTKIALAEITRLIPSLSEMARWALGRVEKLEKHFAEAVTGYSHRWT